MSDFTRKEVIRHLEFLKLAGQIDAIPEKINPDYLQFAIDSLETDEAYNLMYEKVDFIEIPEGATNGQMFCRIFQPYGLKENGSCVWVWFTERDETHYTLSKDWWNSPYRKEQEW